MSVWTLQNLDKHYLLFVTYVEYQFNNRRQLDTCTYFLSIVFLELHKCKQLKILLKRFSNFFTFLLFFGRQRQRQQSLANQRLEEATVDQSE